MHTPESQPGYGSPPVGKPGKKMAWGGRGRGSVQARGLGLRSLVSRSAGGRPWSRARAPSGKSMLFLSTPTCPGPAAAACAGVKGARGASARSLRPAPAQGSTGTPRGRSRGAGRYHGWRGGGPWGIPGRGSPGSGRRVAGRDCSRPAPPKNDTCEFPCMPLKPFKRSVWNAVVLRPTIGYGPAYDSWDAGAPGCLPYRCHHGFSRRHDGYAIPLVWLSSGDTQGRDRLVASRGTAVAVVL